MAFDLDDEELEATRKMHKGSDINVTREYDKKYKQAINEVAQYFPLSSKEIDCILNGEVSYKKMNEILLSQSVSREDDSVYAIRFAVMQKQIDEKDKKIEELERKIRKLETVRYANQYGGTDYIHFITKEKLVTIDTNKYFIEIEEGKFVDLKQVYLDNKNSIPKQKIKDFKEQIKLAPVIVGGRRNGKTLEYGIKLGKIKACEELLEDK